MAFILRQSSGAGSSFVDLPTSSETCAPGDVMAINGNVVTRATSASTTLTIIAVAQSTLTASSSGTKAILIQHGPVQLWEADTTNNTASTQLFERSALTDHDHLNNSGSDVGNTTGVFMPIAVVGAASDKKLLGYFLLPGQAAA